MGDHVVLEMPLGALHAQASTSAATPMDHVDPAYTSESDEPSCRICLDLSEGRETLLLDCSCRGELALAHRECAIEWFSRKGNNICDVCHHIVQNIPLDLLTITSTVGNQQNGTTAAVDDQAGVGAVGGILHVWQEAPALLVVNAFAYFFFILTYLRTDMGDVILPVSVLLSCILCYISVVTSTRMARGRYVWLYAMVQFTCVVISAYAFHLMVKLKKQLLLSILFACLVGFGVTFCSRCIVLGFLKLRTWWLQQQQQEEEDANNN